MQIFWNGQIFLENDSSFPCAARLFLKISFLHTWECPAASWRNRLTKHRATGPDPDQEYGFGTDKIFEIWIRMLEKKLHASFENDASFAPSQFVPRS